MIDEKWRFIEFGNLINFGVEMFVEVLIWRLKCVGVEKKKVSWLLILVSWVEMNSKC